MFSAEALFNFILLYVFLLLIIAFLTDQYFKKNPRITENPIVYSLSLTVFLTSWTFFGMIGSAARSGFDFLALYIGATLSVIFWWSIFRRLVAIKNEFKITSIADLLSARYGKSQSVAIVTTLLVTFGIVPYIALQLKSIITTSEVLITEPGNISTTASTWIGFLVAAIMIIFTILFGIRKVSPTERHPGIIMAITVESFFKLAAFLIGAIFIIYTLNDGLEDILHKAKEVLSSEFFITAHTPEDLIYWITSIFIAMLAVMFLPRQFHVAIVENADERHIKTAVWLFPLYMILITIFVFPITLSGLIAGIPIAEADTYFLRLPMEAGNKLITLLVFLGGFSAATGMIMISSMTASTMVSNHIVIPLFSQFKATRKLIYYVKEIRWGIVFIFISICYIFEEITGESYFLYKLGIISFVATIQVVPALVGGLYWKKATKAGAIAGISGGFLIWGYTMLLPSFIKSGWLPEVILEKGVLGLGIFRPEALFGVTYLDPLSHSTFFSFSINLVLFLFVSLLTKRDEVEEEIMQRLDHLWREEKAHEEITPLKADVNLKRKLKKLRNSLRRQISYELCEQVIKECLDQFSFKQDQMISLIEFTHFYSYLERQLSGILGVATAYRLLKEADLFSPAEQNRLSRIYSQQLASMQIDPQVLIKKVEFYQEQKNILEKYAQELNQKVEELNREITEREKIKNLLKESQEKLQAIIQQSKDGIIVIGKEGAILEWNYGAELITGYKRDEIINRKIWEILPLILPENVMQQISSFLPQLPAMLEQFYQMGKGLTLQKYKIVDIMHQNGQRKKIEIHTFPIKLGNVYLLGSISRDLSDIEFYNRALTKSEERTQLIIRNAIDPICVIREGEIVLHNPIFEAEFQVTPEEIKEKGIELLFEIIPNFRGKLDQIKGKNLTISHQEFIGISRHNQQIYLEVSSFPIDWDNSPALVFILRNITSQKQLEFQLNQLQKMEAIGRLAGGISHDFNNILTSILGLAELATLSLDEKHPVREDISEIVKAAEKASNLTRKLLAFSKKQVIKPTVLNINRVIKELTKMLTRLIGEDIEFHLDLADQVKPIYADVGQIEQILINLVVNSRDAINARPGGEKKITIFTGITKGEMINTTIPDRAKPGHDYVYFSVKDTGCGMDKEVISRIFEPFFTTKETGEGTGLGLSTVYGIIQQNEALIDVKSKPETGSTFTIYWPATTKQIEEIKDIDASFPASRGETILVVEDNQDVLNFVVRSLRSLGYSIFQASNGEEALKIFQERQHQIDLLFTDVIMPGMNGKELANKIQAIKPDCRVLFGTGYPDKFLDLDVRKEQNINIIYKPYSFRTVAIKVRECLENR